MARAIEAGREYKDIREFTEGDEFADTAIRRSKAELVEEAQAMSLTPSELFIIRMRALGANIVSLGYYAPRQSVGRAALELYTD
jgi:hypothetical protein